MIVHSTRLRSPSVHSGRRKMAQPSDTSLSLRAFTKRCKNSKTPKAGVPSHSACGPQAAETVGETP